MTTSWRERHHIASLLTEHYPDVRRLSALAESAGLTLSPPQGFSTLFVAASRLLLDAGDALPSLLEKAAEAHEAFAAWGPQPEPEPAGASTQVAETELEDAVPSPRPLNEAEPGAAHDPRGLRPGRRRWRAWRPGSRGMTSTCLTHCPRAGRRLCSPLPGARGGGGRGRACRPHCVRRRVVPGRPGDGVGNRPAEAAEMRVVPSRSLPRRLSS